MQANRPTYRVSADRHSSSRRVRYVEYSAGSDDCQLCQLDTVHFPGNAASCGAEQEPVPALSDPERPA